jgi:hypothetical protein
MVYLNDTLQGNISPNYYNVTGLVPKTEYTISTRTVDINGNINSTWVNDTTITLDLTPPASIANLQNTSENDWINWTWNNPSDPDFNGTMVYIDGVWEINVSKPLNYYNSTYTAHATKTISTHTVDTSGNINETWVNQTTTIPNNNPVLETIGDKSVDEGQTLTIDANATDLDSDILTYSCNRTDLFADFNSFAGKGNWTPLSGDAGTYYVDFGVYDGYGGVDNETVKITVNDVTPPDSITNLQSTTGNFWINWTWNNPSDPDFNYTMVYIDGTFEKNVSVPYYNDTYTAHATKTISTHAGDTCGNINSTWINQTTAIPNNAPVLDSIGDKTVDENKKLAIDADATDLDSDVLTYSCNRTDLFADFNSATGDGNWTPSSGDAGTYHVDFGVYDGYEGVDNETVKITVNDVTPPAPITNLQNVTGNFWVNWSWNNPPDSDFNHTMVYIDGTFEKNVSTPYCNDTYTAHATKTISTHTVDTSGNMNSTWVNQTTTIPNNAPVLDSIDDKTVDENEKLTIDADATDLDSDSLTYSCNRTDLFTDFNSTTGKGNWTPSSGDTGTYYVDFGVSDGYGGMDNETVKITINDVTPPAPITNLQSTTDNFWINWTWTNPHDPDFNHTRICLDGTFQTNTSKNYHNATGLSGGTEYTVSTYTVDKSGNINSTPVNQTAETKSDTTPPTITFVPPTPANNSEVTVDHVFVNVTLNENGNAALLNWNGTNETMLGSNMNFYLNKAGLSNGIYTYRVYANDTSDNWNVSDARVVTVNVPASITDIESSSETGVRKDLFNAGESVFASGSNYAINKDYNISVVADQIWTDGMDIPDRVAGTANKVFTDSSGDIAYSDPEGAGTPPALIWSAAVDDGTYDIVIDVNENGKYDAGIDVLDDKDVGDVGFVVVTSPVEVPSITPLGFLLSLLTLLGLGAVAMRTTYKKR